MYSTFDNMLMLMVVAGFIEKFPALVIGLMPSRRPTTIILETYNSSCCHKIGVVGT